MSSDAFLTAFNNSKFVWGISMLVVNLGSRFIMSGLGKNAERLLSHAWIKPLVFFCIFFMASRDLLVALVLTCIALFVFMIFIHENSKFCCVPKRESFSKKAPTREEYLQALEVIDQYKQNFFST